MTDAKKRAIRTAVQAIVTLTSVQGLGLIAKAFGLNPSQDQLLLLSIVLLPVVTLAQCWLEDRGTVPMMMYRTPDKVEGEADNGDC